MAGVLSEFLGTQRINVDIHGFAANGLPGNLSAVRHFDTAEQLGSEIIEARLWAGLHYRGSTEAGVELGQKSLITISTTRSRPSERSGPAAVQSLLGTMGRTDNRPARTFVRACAIGKHGSSTDE